MKKAVCVFVSLIVALSLTSCNVSGPLVIESGFSEKLVTLLSEQYELNIPDSAEFVSGYFDRAFRDPSVVIYFTVSENEFESIFADNWTKDRSDHTGLFAELNFEPEGNYSYGKELYTALVYSEAENGIINCAFTGRHPGKTFK